MSLRTFLNGYKTSKNYTHLSLAPNGKYYIPEYQLDTLYALIAAEKTPPHILEGREGLTGGPLLIDLDFEYPDEPRFHERQYTSDQVSAFVDMIHTAVKYFFGTVDVEYIVSEKPAVTIEAGKRVKDGIHVLGKGLILSYSDQHKLRLYALQKHFLQNSFCMDYVRNKPEDVYDKSVVEKNAWYLLGCSKPDRAPYMPTLSFYNDEGELMMRKVGATFYTPRELSIRQTGNPIKCLGLRTEEWDSIVEAKPTKQTRKKSPDPESVSQHIQTVVPYSEMTGGRPAFLESFPTLVRLVELWSRDRAIDYTKWRNAIFCIAGCAKACGNIEGGQDLAHRFSQGPKYCKDSVDRVYSAEKNGVLGFVVAHQWARSDNLVEYMNSGFSVWWKIPWAHFTVAREFFGFFPESFLLIGGWWYIFNGVYWERDGDSVKGDSKTIKKWLSTRFYDLLYEQIKSQRDVIDGGEYHKKLAYLNQLLNKSFKNDVLSELGQFYGNSSVKFDTRPELFAFNNRVFDLNAGTWIQPSADMYISITCGYDWVDVGDAEILEMERWVGELFDSVEKTEYVLKLMASCMYRHNREEKAHFLLGRGRNGKGTLKDMMSAALGIYASKIDISYFTQPDKHCGAANPHLYNLKDSRVIWCDEAQTDGRVVGKFSTGKIKSLTGRDKIKARPMYSGDEVEYEAGHFVALVNEMPDFTSFDFALLTRLVCIRFPYVFMPSEEFNPSDTTHRKQDPRIKERVMERREIFIALLLKWYARYDKEGLEMVDCIKTETRAVTDELDAVGGWARGNLVFKVGERTPIQLVYRKYVEDCDKAEKDHVGLEEFGKRLRRCYEVKNCRHNDEYGPCNRIISYRLA
jgi:P4 family phage/plasmid primase-like protien